MLHDRKQKFVCFHYKSPPNFLVSTSIRALIYHSYDLGGCGAHSRKKEEWRERSRLSPSGVHCWDSGTSGISIWRIVNTVH